MLVVLPALRSAVSSDEKGIPGMQDTAKGVTRKTSPWIAGQNWSVVGVQGIFALAMLLVSLGHIVDGFRDRSPSSSPWETLRGGIGATVAVLTLLSAGSDYVEDDGTRQLLAIGLLAYGLLGLISLIFTFRSTGFNG